MEEGNKTPKLKKVGRYEIRRELGRGGMATVYLGYDELFDREVAIKILPAEFLHDPQFSVRFHREAKVIASLEHPATVPVYDVGETDGLPYFVMRYMDGGSLADILEDGQISLQEVSRIIKTIAPALDEAHQKGIIHRDLKPANILFDHYKQPYLSDFGIAKISDSQTNVTGSAIIGTPAYMSPEQAQGKQVDGRSDIYALGAIIYRMLTGTRPYDGDTPMSMAIKHITDPTPDILIANPNLPLSATTFIYRAMAKDPDDRFQSVAELSEALDALSLGEDTAGLHTLPSKTQPAMPKPVLPQEATKKMDASAESIAPKPKKSKIGWVIAGIVLIFGMMGVLGLGLGAKALLTPTATEPAPSPTSSATATSTVSVPVATPPPTSTSAPPTSTPPPTETPVPPLPILGGADKIAFIANNEVWMMNVDGSELLQLTTDGATKDKLQWMPDRKTLIYVVGKCIQTMDTEADRVDVVTCYEQAEYFDAIQISPSGEQIAISMNRELFILPFDLELLQNTRDRNDLRDIASCFYDSESVLDVRWHNDETKIAMRFQGVSGTSRVDLIRIIDISNCQPAASLSATATAMVTTGEDIYLALRTLDEFPANRFTMSGYTGTSPYIPEFDWNGEELFLMHTSKRNDGYGFFYTYNGASHKAMQIDPAGTATCCYRDPRWSPDGAYFIVAYQDITLGAETEIEIYYLLFGTLGTDSTYRPIPMPEHFFENLKEKPQFALRPAD